MPISRSIFASALLIAVAACARNHETANATHHAAPTSASTSRGSALFTTNCAACHGAGGAGGRIGPSLRGERVRKSPAAVRAAIVDPQPPMPKLFPAQLTEQDVDDVTAYVESL